MDGHQTATGVRCYVSSILCNVVLLVAFHTVCEGLCNVRQYPMCYTVPVFGNYCDH